MECGTLALDKLKMLTKEEQMEPKTTCTSNDTTEKRKLTMALELSQKEWKLGFGVGPGQVPRLRSVPGCCLFQIRRYPPPSGRLPPGRRGLNPSGRGVIYHALVASHLPILTLLVLRKMADSSPRPLFTEIAG